MENFLKYIIDNTKTGKIHKESAVEMVKMLKQAEFKENDDIAIIGLSGKMPLAENAEEYWENITSGMDCITSIPPTRSKDLINYLKFTGELEDEFEFCENAYMEEIDKFDHLFFRLSYKEACLMDPHQRLFLQTVWKAIEDAGYGGKKLAGSNTGIYAGYASSLRDIYLKQIYEVEPNALPISMVGNLSAVLPSRISYILDLKGPSMVIDTSCASSLVAITTACDALRNGKCDMAIAGGIKINLLPLKNELMKLGIESSDGRTRAFDDTSDGAGIGEGVGAVILKPLKQALKDGDSIYAVIKGYAVNQDGNCVGITAPNPSAQTDVIVKAWKDAKIDPETITYIETHGTGTKLGDPIEIKGITDAFKKYTNKSQFCAVGSVKANIGHSSEAAGVLSMIKVIMSLKNKTIPPSIYFSNPNQAIPFNESPVYVNTKNREWETDGIPRRCGVSAFGISGTNCHIVLEEAPQLDNRKTEASKVDVLAISSMTEYGLKNLIKEYIKYIRKNINTEVWDIAYTANTGRGHYNHRLIIVFKDREDLLEKLEEALSLESTNSDIYYGYYKVIGSNRVVREAYEITEEVRLGYCKKAHEAIIQFSQSDSNELEKFEELCRLYKMGADIDWEEVYKIQKVNRVRCNLPTYFFEPTRCWLDIPEVVNDVQQDEEEDTYFTVVWNKEEIIHDLKLEDDETIIILKDSKGVWEEFHNRWLAQGARVILVEFGEAFLKNSEDEFIIKGVEEDYDKLICEINSSNIDRIIHLASITTKKKIDSFEELEENQLRGVYSMFYLTRAIVRAGLDTNVNINVISEFVYEVTGVEEKICPENAPLFGIGKAINQEHPGIKIKCIDVDTNVDYDRIIAEFSLEDTIYQVAHRDSCRYVEEFREIQLENVVDNPVQIKEDGIYIITGGTGGVGLEIARYLSSINKIRIALISRTPVVAREQWKSILESNDNTKLCRTIDYIQRIEASGSEVIWYSGNVSNLLEIQYIYKDLKDKYGKINGIIHAAGIPGDGFLHRKSHENFDRVLDPKLYGTWVLDHVTSQEELDFFIMFSSGLAILSEPGHGDYTAANAYLDSFSAYRRKKNKKALAINWTTWKETGMAVDYGFNYDSIFKAITTQNALEGFGEILKKDIGRVLIGEFSYNPQFLYLIDRLPFKLSPKIRTKAQRIIDENRKVRATKTDNCEKATGAVALKGRDGEEFSQIEVKVAQIYNELLGFKEIDINDSFFELGGDSVMINRMHAILEKEYPGQVKLIDLFNYTTIATLSQYITAKLEGEDQAKKDDDLEDLGRMLEEIENGTISIDEALDKIS